MKLIYLASPYTAMDSCLMFNREQEVTKAAGKLQYKYKNIAFFLPITQSAAMKRFEDRLGTAFTSWAKIDLFIVKDKAEEVWVLCIPGWKESIGVQAEIKHALKYKKAVFYIHPVTLRKTKRIPRDVE